MTSSVPCLCFSPISYHSLSGPLRSHHTDLSFLNLAKLTPTLRFWHFLHPLHGRLLPFIFHMAASLLLFKSQLKCHLRIAFPCDPIQNSHSVTCHLISNHCLISLCFIYYYALFFWIIDLFAYVLSLFLFLYPSSSLPPTHTKR